MFKEGYHYFEENLNLTERKFYKKVYEAIKERKPYITFNYKTEASSSRAGEIIRYVYDDHPSFFYMKPYNSTYSVVETNIGKYTFTYCYDINTSNEYENKIKRMIQNYFDKYKILELKEYERILAIHNLISTICTYDPVVLNKGNGADEDYNIVGVFSGRVAVCYGFSLAFKLLCDYANIPCLVARGVCNDGGGHAWNMVRYLGKFYAIDVTWDLRNHDPSLYGKYLYFMVDDAWMAKTRSLNNPLDYPKCNGLEYSFYGIQNAIIKMEELEEFLYLKLCNQPKEIVAYVKEGKFSYQGVVNAYNSAAQRFMKVYPNFKGSAKVAVNVEYNTFLITL